jgi:hypothetical protein
MARLIEVQDVGACPSQLMIYSGDVLLFRAAGGRVRPGGEVIELLGPFLQVVLGPAGDILSPAGLPNTVMFHARRPGQARIDVITGNSFQTPQTTTLDIIIEP